MTDETKKEFTRRISQGSATEIIVILYEIAIKYMEDTEDFLKKDMHEDARRESANAVRVFGHLTASLDFTYAISMNLYRIYEYISKEVSMAVIRNSAEGLEAPIRMMKSLKESFEKLAREDQSGPMMDNSQTVYTGLTYGKGSLNDSTVVGECNRGFMV